MKALISIVLLVLLIQTSFAQERDVKKLSHEKKHKVAHGLITKNSYYNAVDHLLELVKEHPNNKKYVRNLADAYFLSRDYKNAEIWYEKVVKMDGKTTTLALFKYAESQKFNGKYEEAKKNFQDFSKSKYKEQKGERYKPFAVNEVLSCDYAIKNSEKVNPLDVIHLGDHVNSKYTEFSPSLKNDSTLVFASLQSDTIISIHPEESHTFHVKLLQSVVSNDIWGTPTEVPNVNSLYESNANGVFSTDKSKFYFTRCVPNHHNKMVCNIYKSEIKDSIFGKPEKLKGYINVKGHTTTMPYITQVMMGKKLNDVLFFVSDRKGTRGGLDIWYAIADGKGGFKKPVNLGKAVNTIRDEVSPFFEASSGTLYFSSNFHFGFGGYDVFKSTSKQFGFWNTPENLGKPINTRVDDTYYNINRNTNEGFFVSNRPEGYHLTSETCCDDIYSFKLKNPFLIKTEVYVKGTSQKADSCQIVVTNRPFKSFFNYNGSLVTAADTLPTAIDSLNRVYADSVKRYLKNGLVSFEKKERNTIVDNSFYPELKDARHLVDAELGKEYMVYAMDKRDTVVYTFTIDSLVRKFSNPYTPDTSDGKAIVYNGKRIDIIQLDLYLDAKPVPVDTPTVAVVEDEKTFTVAKLREDIKAPVKHSLKVILNYDFDDANFIKDHAKSLDSMVTFMKDYPEVNISINAHTDSKGSDRYNHELSKRRAKSIEDYMEKHGIDKKRIRSSGRGEMEPLLPNENPDGSDNAENRRINRRAEILIDEDVVVEGQ